MATAPTRRPESYPDQRRPTKGSRPMAGMIRPHLAETVQVLKEAGRYDLATTMAELGKPRGYLLLQRTDTVSPSPISLTTTKAIKDELREAETEMDKVLDSLADDAYRRVLSGWLPPKWQKPGRGRAGGPPAVLQVQVDSELRQQVQEALPALSKKAGYTVRESNILLTYLCDELGVHRGVEAAMPLLLPLPVRDHFVAARESGTDLNQLVDTGVRRLLDGSWEMPRPARAPKGTRGGETGKLYVDLKDDVRDALHELAPRLSEKFGVRVFPGTIVRVILTDRLGEPAA
ncbi:hypothetical protein [Streptomyces sp. NPDC048521]|uniref:hypothetical protein n=1 Tax=Streptomyces sp. NPDC048521 TaxID=3365566 RepID=UPI003716EE47